MAKKTTKTQTNDNNFELFGLSLAAGLPKDTTRLTSAAATAAAAAAAATTAAVAAATTADPADHHQVRSYSASGTHQTRLVVISCQVYLPNSKS